MHNTLAHALCGTHARIRIISRALVFAAAASTHCRVGADDRDVVCWEVIAVGRDAVCSELFIAQSLALSTESDRAGNIENIEHSVAVVFKTQTFQPKTLHAALVHMYCLCGVRSGLPK